MAQNGTRSGIDARAFALDNYEALRPSRLEELACRADVDVEWLRGHLRTEIRRRLSPQAERDAQVESAQPRVKQCDADDAARWWVAKLSDEDRVLLGSAIELLA